jgi:hypothetical protein
MFLAPLSRRAPRARLRQVGMARVRCRSAAGGVLGERGVLHVVQGLDFPVRADECRRLWSSGLLSGQARYRVNGLHRGLPGLAVGAAALDLACLPGSRVEQVVLTGLGRCRNTWSSVLIQDRGPGDASRRAPPV